MADIEGGMFGDKDYFKPLVDGIHNMKVGNDWFLLANDFADYLRAQEEVDAAYKDQGEWLRRSIMYTAGSGMFSSDRTIREYAQVGAFCVNKGGVRCRLTCACALHFTWADLCRDNEDGDRQNVCVYAFGGGYLSTVQCGG
jgi:hypothetical protein